MQIEADLSDDEVDDVLELGEDICHVHDSLKESLYADVDVSTDAF
jgi:uncharacterized OsmC-like protein